MANLNQDPPINRKFTSKEVFRTIMIAASICHLILVPLLFMYVPVPLIWSIAAVSLVFNCIVISRSATLFHYMGSQYGAALGHFLLFLSYFLLMYLGAVFQVSQGSWGILSTLLLFGFVPWFIAGYKGWRACSEVHIRQIKSRLKSVNLETGIYDAHSDSLNRMELSDAITESSSIWNWLLILAIGLSPGPIFGVMAGKISSHFRYIAALPATWGAILIFGFMALRLAFDFWVIRKIESENRVRLMLSTSPLNPAHAPNS